jgi:filamin
MKVSSSGAAELAVSVRNPNGELPVRVTGNIQSGFTAEFTPTSVGAHTINVDYNGYPVQVNFIQFSSANYKINKNI